MIIIANAPTATPAVKCMSLRMETSVHGGNRVLRQRTKGSGSAACVVGALGQPFEIRTDRLPELGQGGFGGATAKQLAAQFALETLDCVGQRRLRNAAALCGQRESLVAAERQKIPDMCNLHGSPPSTRRTVRRPHLGIRQKVRAKTKGRGELFPISGTNFPGNKFAGLKSLFNVSQATSIRWPDFDCRPAVHPTMPLAVRLPAALEYYSALGAPRPSQAILPRGSTLSSSDFEEQADLGNAKARFARLVLPHLAAAYGLARSLTRNPSDAEDVVQEACLRAYRALSNTPVANARAWVLTIVHNTAYTWLRKNRPQSIVAVDNLENVEHTQSVSLEAATSTPEAEIIAKTDGARLEAMMRELPPQFREVLMLREVEGYSYREIAEVTGVPIGTVMSRLKRARDQLIAAIGREQS